MHSNLLLQEKYPLPCRKKPKYEVLPVRILPLSGREEEEGEGRGTPSQKNVS